LNVSYRSGVKGKRLAEILLSPILEVLDGLVNVKSLDNDGVLVTSAKTSVGHTKWTWAMGISSSMPGISSVM
jgi:hypothetical protein